MKPDLIGLFTTKSDQKVIACAQDIFKRQLSMAERRGWKKLTNDYGITPLN